jgi:hypothetical protein
LFCGRSVSAIEANAAQDFLRGRISEYGRSDLGDQPRPEIDMFESIETINAATVAALFVGPVDFQAAISLWWEVWVRDSVNRVRALTEIARTVALDIHPDRRVSGHDHHVHTWHSVRSACLRSPCAWCDLRDTSINGNDRTPSRTEHN